MTEDNQQKAVQGFFKGIKYGNVGDLISAFSYLSNAITVMPDFSAAYYERGLINVRLNMFHEAIRDFTKTVELNPQDVMAMNNRGLAYARGLNKYNEAIRDFTRSIELEPELAISYVNRGIAFSKSSDARSKACSDWKKACDLGSCNSFNLSTESGFCK